MSPALPVPRPGLDPGAPPGDAWVARRTRAVERIARTLAWSVAFVVAVAVVWAEGDIVLLIFAAVLLATLLRGAADGLAGTVGGRASWWLAAILVTVLGGIGLTLWLRGPMLVAEARDLWHQLRDQAGALWARFGAADWLQPLIGRLKGYADEGGRSIAGMVAGFGSSTLGVVGSLVVTVVAALYFALDPALYLRGTVRLMPKAWRPRAAEVMIEVGHTLRWWFVGQFVDMLVVGFLTGLGLYLLGIKLAFTLALIAALFNFVPYVGALAGAVPAVLVALGQGPREALYVAALFVAVQALEGNVIAPLVQKRTVELAPVLTILSQTVLGSLFGPLGLILATPLAAAAVVAVRMVYVEDVLGDRDDGA